MNRKKSLLLYSAALAILFWLLPFLFRGGIGFLFLINPLSILIGSVLHSKKYGFDLFTVLIAVVFFGPTIFLFYNESAWIYIVFYGIVSFIGNLIGWALYKGKQKEPERKEKPKSERI